MSVIPILRFRQIKRTAIFYILTFCVLFIVCFHIRNGFEFYHAAAIYNLTASRSTVISLGSFQGNGSCKLPNLPVDAPEMMQFVKTEPPIDCSAAEPDWVTVEGSTCIITKQAKKKYGSITCNFTDIIRETDHKSRNGITTVSNSSYTLQASDVVTVTCTAKEKKWHSVLIGIRKDPAILNSTGWSKVPLDGLHFNVLIFGFDSLSRNTVIRKLPKTYKYLTEELKAHVLEGYNIVGDGTPQALIPIFTGKTELELPDTRKRMKNSHFVNVYPFVWNDFAKNGYVTAYFEDMANVGTFTYRLNGFQKMPTHHYSRPYYLEAIPDFNKSPRLCYGSTPRHMIMINLIKNFFSVYKDKPKFLFGFHGELSHGSYNLIGLADDDVLNFFTELKTSGILDNTLLIFMADHGARFTSVRNTVQGKQEERLPFFSFRFPDSFRADYEEHFKNLVKNKRRLTTPFDIYPTLKSVLSMSYNLPADLSQRSISLFREIPETRSCTDAGIDAHWCSCLDWKIIPNNSPIVPKLIDTFLNTINGYTSKHRDICEKLSFKNLEWVMELVPTTGLLKFKQNLDKDGFVSDLTSNMSTNVVLYEIKIMLQPGDSLFETTISHFLKENKFNIKETDISRVNKYGNHARCLKDSLLGLRKYCYCK